MPRDGDPFDATNPPPDGRGALPPELDPRGRTHARAAAGGTPRPTRARPRRRRDVASGLVLGGRILAALLSLSILVAAGVSWARYRQFNAAIPRVDAINSSSAPTKDLDGKDQNILIVGNDDRETATDAELAELGTTRDGGSLNTDTMMILHVPADGKKATGISFPRDSWVAIPGHGMGKLNSAYPDGVADHGGDRSAGAQLLVQTLQNLTGLTIDHYVQVDLLGFYRISSAIGGVTVCLNEAQHEANSGIDLPAGASVIQGKQALAFVRQRYGLPRGDLDRIVRQQYFLSAVFRKVSSAGTLLNPLKLNNLLNAVSKSLTIDPGLDLLKLAQQMQDLSAGNLTFAQIPTSSDMINGQSVQVVDKAGMRDLINTLIGVPADDSYAKAKLVAPSSVTVNVLNGSGENGVAGANAATLNQAGFKTTIGDGNSSATTIIQYPSGMESQAKTLAQYVPGAAVAKTANVSGVTLLLGADGKVAYPTVTTAAPTTAPPATGGAAPTTNPDTRTAAQSDCIN